MIQFNKHFYKKISFINDIANNCNVLYWDNVLGTGRMVMLKGNFGIANEDGDNNFDYYEQQHLDSKRKRNNNSRKSKLKSKIYVMIQRHINTGPILKQTH